MASLSYPLPLVEFFDALRVRTVRFALGQNVATSTTGGGEVIRHALGARLWQGDFALAPGRHADIVRAEALMALVEEAGASFLIYDRRKPGPAYDPDGSILGAATVQIASLPAGDREIALKGLPSGYVITPGDQLAFEYSSNPVRYALHRAVTGATADVAGLTPAFQVTPKIRDGAAVDATVSLVKPVCKARLVEATYGSGRPLITEGGSLRWTQTLR